MIEGLLSNPFNFPIESMKFFLLLITLFVLVYTKDRKEELYNGKITLKAYTLLEERGVISSKTFQELKTELFENLAVSGQDLERISYSNGFGATSSPPQGSVAKALGFFTFVNIIWVVAIFIFVSK